MATARTHVGERPISNTGMAIWLGLLSVVAIWFISRYAIRYYIPGNPVRIGLTLIRTIALLAHISGGIVALLVGPWQFSSTMRQSYPRVHRVSGRIYLVAVGIAGSAAFLLAITTRFGWAWGVGVGALGCVWVGTTGTAFYAIRQRDIRAHREWMQRSYIATFAFVIFRLLVDFPPMNRLGPAHDLWITAIWACWAIPMLGRETLVQVRDFRRHIRRSAVARSRACQDIGKTLEFP